MSRDLKRRDDRKGPSTSEKGLMAVAAVLTVTLFGFLIGQALLGPSGPALEVEVVAVQEQADRVWVTVELRNGGNEGVRSATLSVDCDTPAPSVTLEHVAADVVVQARLLCPPGTADPQASIEAIVPR